MNDLERDGCRSIPEINGGRPFCFYEGSTDIPEENWKWEECDIPVCEKNCTRYIHFLQNCIKDNCLIFCIGIILQRIKHFCYKSNVKDQEWGTTIFRLVKNI